MAKRSSKSAISVATSDEAGSFIRSLQKKFAGNVKSVAGKERLRQYLGTFDEEHLRSVARRALIDVIQHPSQAAGTRPPRKSGKS